MEKAWLVGSLRHRTVALLLMGLLASLSGGLVGVSFFWLESAANADLANRRLYRSEMNLASQYLVKGDFDGVRRTLDRFTADERLAGLRDFAWYYHEAAISPYLSVSNQGVRSRTWP